MGERTVLHVDMNNFYASVECLHDPSLRGRPVAVGGRAEERHGIILAKNNEAKAYGIQTGDALWQAREKCGELVIGPPHYDRYIRFSSMAGAIYGEYTDRIEPFGLDEAWLDISGGGARQGSGREVADEIRRRIRDELGITASVGVSFNKVFAKLGSDMKKPDATTVLSRDNYRQRVWPLPVEALLCVGAATCRKLHSRGIYTIGQLAAADPRLLQAWFGKWGLTLHRFANGRDSSPVRPAGQEAAVKSVGNSSTTPRDLMNERDARVTFAALAESVGARLREYGLKGSTVQISLRDRTLAGFERQMRLQAPTDLSRELFEAAMTLLRRHYDWSRPLRSVGLRACGLVPWDTPVQLSFFGEEARRQREERLEHAVDSLRLRFGPSAIRKGTLYEDTLLGQLNAKEDHTIHPVSFFS